MNINMRYISFVLLFKIAVYITLFFGFRWRTFKPDLDPLPEVVAALAEQYPMVVNASPDGFRILLKTRLFNAFEINVIDAHTRKTIASDFSLESQLSLTWRPDGEAVVFQESKGGNRDFSLFILDVATGKRRLIDAPKTQSAASPLRWSPSGDKLAYMCIVPGQNPKLVIVRPDAPSSPPITVASMGADGDFSWSPDGQRLAFVSNCESGVVEIIGPNMSTRRTYLLGPNTKIKYLVWTANSREIIFTARNPFGEFFDLRQLDLETSRSITILQEKRDIVFPIAMPGSDMIIYHVNDGFGLKPFLYFLDKGSRRQLISQPGNYRLLYYNNTQSKAIVLENSFEGPPRLLGFYINNDKIQAIEIPRSVRKSSCVPPVALRIVSRDGTQVPAWLWCPQIKEGDTQSQSVVIEVHGGRKTRASIEWDAGRNWLINSGVCVLSVDPRGSTGFGATYEDSFDQALQVDDVLAAVDFAVNRIAKGAGRIVMTGTSAGARLVSEAAIKRADRLYGVVIESFPDSVIPQRRIEGGGGSVPRVFAFHGENDSILSSDVARRSIENIFGPEALKSPDGHWEVLSHEGHHFHRTSSRSKILSAVALLISGKHVPAGNMNERSTE